MFPRDGIDIGSAWSFVSGTVTAQLPDETDVDPLQWFGDSFLPPTSPTSTTRGSSRSSTASMTSGMRPASSTRSRSRYPLPEPPRCSVSSASAPAADETETTRHLDHDARTSVRASCLRVDARCSRPVTSSPRWLDQMECWCSNVANVNVGRSNRLTRFSKEHRPRPMPGAVVFLGRPGRIAFARKSRRSNQKSIDHQ